MSFLNRMITLGSWQGTVQDWLILLGIAIIAWIFWLPLLFGLFVNGLGLQPRATVRWLYMGLYATIVCTVVLWQHPPYFDFFTSKLAVVGMALSGLIEIVMMIFSYKRALAVET